jgi:hypothetical protein
VGIAASGVAVNDLGGSLFLQPKTSRFLKKVVTPVSRYLAAPDCFALRPESPVRVLVPWGPPDHPRVQPAGETAPGSHAQE